MVNWCYLCMAAAKYCNHLLLWCPMTYSIWNMVYTLLGINWVIGESVKKELWAWDEIGKNLKFVKPIP